MRRWRRRKRRRGWRRRRKRSRWFPGSAQSSFR
jgi:hypothetical protein